MTFLVVAFTKVAGALLVNSLMIGIVAYYTICTTILKVKFSIVVAFKF